MSTGGAFYEIKDWFRTPSLVYLDNCNINHSLMRTHLQQHKIVTFSKQFLLAKFLNLVSGNSVGITQVKWLKVRIQVTVKNF